MIIKIEQTNKEAFSANFNIVAENRVIGSANFRCKSVNIDGEWNIEFMGRQVCMKRVIKGPSKSFRPYEVVINGNKCGWIYQTDYKTGFLKPRIYHHRLNINGTVTDIFPIGFGEDIKSPVYCSENQVALVEKSLTVYDDLHVFDVFSLNESGAFSSILLSFYMYSSGYYKAGEIPLKKTEKGYSLCKEKELLAKYNPDFKNKII